MPNSRRLSTAECSPCFLARRSRTRLFSAQAAGARSLAVDHQDPHACGWRLTELLVLSDDLGPAALCLQHEFDGLPHRSAATRLSGHVVGRRANLR